jgi:hypothetical protein
LMLHIWKSRSKSRRMNFKKSLASLTDFSGQQ